jgi:hypothetical protein
MSEVNTVASSQDSPSVEQVWKNAQMVKAISNLLSEIISENKQDKNGIF